MSKNNTGLPSGQPAGKNARKEAYSGKLITHVDTAKCGLACWVVFRM